MSELVCVYCNEIPTHRCDRCDDLICATHVIVSDQDHCPDCHEAREKEQP